MNRIAHLFDQSADRFQSVEGWNEWCPPQSRVAKFGDPLGMKETARLLLQLVNQASQRDDLVAQLKALAQKVERHEKLLNEIFSEPSVVPVGSYEEWCASDAASSFKGKHVIFIESKGVVASSDSLDDLIVKVGGSLKQGMVVGFVPSI
jgi:hypothetical protein